MSIGLTVNKVLYDNIVWSLWKVLCCYCLYLHSEVEVWHVLKWNWRHTNLILLCWNLYHWCVLIYLVKFFQADYLRHFTIYCDRKAQRFGIFKLNLKDSTNFVIFFHRWNFDSNFNLSSFFSSNFKSDLFEILVSLVTSYTEDVLVEVIELLVTALGNNS